MAEWESELNSKIDEKLKDAKKRDVRFFRIDEFKRNIKRADSFSTSCPYCLKQKIYITEMVNNIEEAVNKPGKTRRDYDRLISQLANHMQKEHGFYAPFYFTYLYAFLGMVAGVVAGYLLMKLLPQFNWAMLSLGFVAGLIAGYVRGMSKDSAVRSSKKLM